MYDIRMVRIEMYSVFKVSGNSGELHQKFKSILIKSTQLSNFGKYFSDGNHANEVTALAEIHANLA